MEKKVNVAFIPVRGGSKSIPLKNIKELCGKPLVCWTIEAAVKCTNIDYVYVSTDSQDILNSINKFNYEKVEIVPRSKETATDVASTESAMLEFADKYDFDNIVLIQATSPLLNEDDLKKGFEVFEQENVDSVLSATRQKRFYWEMTDDGMAKSINYDYNNRPRRQDFSGYLVENGAFYITSRSNLLKSKNRISGNIKLAEMDEDSYFEIDEPSDWEIIEGLMKRRIKPASSFPKIKMFITDCDGCLTDGGMYYSEKGDELKKFNTKDGMGFSLLQNNQIITGIITGEDTELNVRRANKMKLDFIKSGIKNKMECLLDLCDKYSIKLEEVAYVGDDINDLEVIKKVGLGCCVNNAVPIVKEYSKYVTKLNGGDGAVREVIDKILGEI